VQKEEEVRTAYYLPKPGLAKVYLLSAPDPLALELSRLDHIQRLETLFTVSRTTRGALPGAKALSGAAQIAFSGARRDPDSVTPA